MDNPLNYQWSFANGCDKMPDCVQDHYICYILFVCPKPH